jgi:type II secretory pathway pseudopilin PulG
MRVLRRAQRRSVRGISLVEALVAMAVMGFGMLGVLGVQAGLRGNADESRQRAEAVRLAQEEIERWRGYAALDDPGAGLDYARLESDDPDEATPTVEGINATYTISRTVAEPPSPTGVTPHGYKVLRVDVGWTDRSGAERSIRFSSNIVGVPPELAAVSVVAGGDPTARPRGRNFSIPLPAVNLGDGRSAFRPPQPDSGTVAWVFSHSTGLISTCTTTALGTEALSLDNISACGAFNARLVTGYVSFVTSTAPTVQLAASPPNEAVAIDVRVKQTAPSTLTTACSAELAPGSSLAYAVYFCAVPVEISPSVSPWSGRVYIATVNGIVPSTSSVLPADRRVCRYTDSRFPNNNALTANPGMRNQDHPLDYLNVTEALTNQNFLIIAAGDGIAAYTCPADDPLAPVTAAVVTTFIHPSPL